MVYCILYMQLEHFKQVWSSSRAAGALGSTSTSCRQACVGESVRTRGGVAGYSRSNTNTTKIVGNSLSERLGT